MARGSTDAVVEEEGGGSESLGEALNGRAKLVVSYRRDRSIAAGDLPTMTWDIVLE